MRYGNELREALKSGRAIGGHVFLGDPAISEALAIYGYDFHLIDAEHGAFDRPLILSHVIAANAGGAAAVRVPSWSMEAVKPVLEMGIDGIIIPQTKGYEDAKRRWPSASILLGGSRPAREGRSATTTSTRVNTSGTRRMRSSGSSRSSITRRSRRSTGLSPSTGLMLSFWVRTTSPPRSV